MTRILKLQKLSCGVLSICDSKSKSTYGESINLYLKYSDSNFFLIENIWEQSELLFFLLYSGILVSALICI